MMKMKQLSNLYINTIEELDKSKILQKNKSSKFKSLNFNKSLTTNTSGETFSTLYNTVENSKIIKNNNFKNVKLKFSNSNSKFSSINISIRNYNNKNNTIFPSIKSPTKTMNVIKTADAIIRIRRGRYQDKILKQTKSNLLKKSKLISLNNFLITQIKGNKDKINNLEKEISTKLKQAEKQFLADYKSFKILEENVNKSIKKRDREFNSVREITIKKEKDYFEEELVMMSLEHKIENITKQIILLQTFSKFICKVFNLPFFFEEINEMNSKDKKYLNLYKRIISIYDDEKNIIEENSKILNEYKEFMKRFQFFERKIIKNFQIKDEIEQEINDIKLLHKKLLEQLYIRKEDFENEYHSSKISLLEIHEEINNINKIKQQNLSDLELCSKCIYDLGQDFGLDLNKNYKDIPFSEFTLFCKRIISFLEGKENAINIYIDQINNLIKTEDKEMVGEIINKRKKINKKEKYREYFENEKIEAEKRKFKSINAKRKIVIKGRKVFQDIPIIKKKNKVYNKNIINNKNEALEYLEYSSDKG